MPLAAMCSLALLTGQIPGPVTVPCMVEAESDVVEHSAGLGNVHGFWALWSNSGVTLRCVVAEGGLHKIVVCAAGDPATNPDTGERWPVMVVEVDGGSGGSHRWDVTAGRGSPGIYVTDALLLTPGEHAITVSFANDYSRGGEDRNLFLDWIGVGPVEGEDSSPVLTPAEKLIRDAPLALSSDWDFTAGSVHGWQACKDADLVLAEDALAVIAAGPEPMICSPRLALDTDTLTWVSVIMRADAGAKGELRWSREGGYGLQRLTFPVVADGRQHVYVLDMLASPDWAGTVTGLVLRPTDVAGARVEIASVRVSVEPQGPAELVIRWFGFDEAIARAGQDQTLVCDFENVGAEEARDVAATLSLPEGIELVAGSTESAATYRRGRHRLAWVVRADRPVSADATVELSGANFTSVAHRSPLAVTQRIEAYPGIADGARYVPEPAPAASEYVVGSYYFPGWRQGTHSGWTAIMPFPERKPVLGWYQEGDPAIADWHTKWAVEHGISFFAYDWYWDRGARSLEHALHDGYLKSRYRSYLKFCLLWANHNPPGSTSEEDLEAVTRFWLDNYFHEPEYLLVDNKPVVIIFSPYRITSDIGSEAAAKAFERMASMCRAEGFDGLYLVGCVRPDRWALEWLRTEGYAAASGYNYPDAGMRPEDGVRAPYDAAVEGYHALWQQAAEAGVLDYIPITDPGWDSRPWHGDAALVRTGKHPDKFRRMLELARAYADEHPVGSERMKMVLIECWNEFGEGASIEPHREFGFGYLDAVRQVFADAAEPHDDVIPADIGLAVPQWSLVEPRTAWEFDGDGDPQGWGAMMGLADFRVEGGTMSATAASDDPAFTCALSGLDASRYRRVVIRMRTDGGRGGQLFWSTSHMPISERTSVTFDLIPDGDWHEYLLDLSGVRTWRGEVTSIRLDPTDARGAHVAVDAVRFLE